MTEIVHEIWRPVAGYEGLYEVSDRGRVKSLARRDRRGCPVPERILMPRRNRGGYLEVALCRDGSQTTAKVHRLVCEAFHGPAPAGKPHALHGNHKRADNRAENLRWGDNAENMQDRNAAGRQARNKGEANGSARLSEADVKTIQDELLAGATQEQLASKYGLRHSTISDIARGETWAHLANPELQARLSKRKRRKTLTDEEVLQVFDLTAEGQSQWQIAARLGVSRPAVSHILHGRTPRHRTLSARWLEAQAAQAGPSTCP